MTCFGHAVRGQIQRFISHVPTYLRYDEPDIYNDPTARDAGRDA